MLCPTPHNTPTSNAARMRHRREYWAANHVVNGSPPLFRSRVFCCSLSLLGLTVRERVPNPILSPPHLLPGYRPCLLSRPPFLPACASIHPSIHPSLKAALSLSISPSLRVSSRMLVKRKPPWVQTLTSVAQLDRSKPGSFRSS